MARIRGAIIDELRSLDWVPRSVRTRARQIERAIAVLERELMRAPTDAEIAHKLGVSADELEESLRPKGATDRIAIGAAGDDRLAVRKVMRLVDRLGFDPVDLGPLEKGVTLEPDGSPIATTYSADELSKLVSP